jgi:hypothetical protein
VFLKLYYVYLTLIGQYYIITPATIAQQILLYLSIVPSYNCRHFYILLYYIILYYIILYYIILYYIILYYIILYYIILFIKNKKIM